MLGEPPTHTAEFGPRFHLGTRNGTSLARSGLAEGSDPDDGRANRAVGPRKFHWADPVAPDDRPRRA